MRCRKALPVLPASPQVRCEPLKCTLSLSACAARWRLANAGGPKRTHSAGAVHDMREAARLTPCKRCEVGRTRNQERTGR